MCTVFPDNVKTGPSFKGISGYFNLDSGWALAARGVEVLTARVIRGQVIGGKAVAGACVCVWHQRACDVLGCPALPGHQRGLGTRPWAKSWQCGAIPMFVWILVSILCIIPIPSSLGFV